MTKARDLAGFSTGSITNTTADGLILKGDGSSTDVVIKNGADATVASVADGTVNIAAAGSITATGASVGALARGAIQVGNSSGVAAALAKGTSGYVLTAGANDLSWAEGGGGGTEFISSTGEMSNVATASFTGFDSSKYDDYVFRFNYVRPVSDNQKLFGHASTNGGSSYDETNGNYHFNGATDTTGFNINHQAGAGDDTHEYGIAGELRLFKPHASTYTTAYAATVAWSMGGYLYNGAAGDYRASAYFFTTEVNAIQFKFGSGNILSGEISMFGIVNS